MLPPEHSVTEAVDLDRPAGVYAAVLTPFDDSGAPDAGALALHCRWLLARGCDGLSVLGTTGEGNSLTVDERIALLERLTADGIPAQVLLPGTGCTAIPDTVRLTERAVQLGAPGVLMLPPFYYKSVSDDGLFAAFAEVIERVADSRLRIYLYNFPQMTGLSFSMALIERLLTDYPATIVGMKDSSGDFANMPAPPRRLPASMSSPARTSSCCRCCAAAASAASLPSATSRHRWPPDFCRLAPQRRCRGRGGARPADGSAQGFRRLSAVAALKETMATHRPRPAGGGCARR